MPDATPTPTSSPREREGETCGMERDGYACNEPKGHDGPHKAWGGHATRPESEWPAASLPPSAGSGETELDRLTAYVAGCLNGLGSTPDQPGYADDAAWAAREASQWLAAHPAGPTRAEEGEADYIAQLIGDLAGVVERKERLNAVAHALLLRKAAKLLRRPATPTTEEP